MGDVLHGDSGVASHAHNAIEIEAASCPVQGVVVYIDRAEVSRTVTADLKRGENEVTVKKLSPAIDKDSIRVEGSGSSTITEVTYSSRANPLNQQESAGANEALKQEEERLLKKRNSMELEKDRISKQREVLDSLSGQIATGGEGKEESGSFVSALGKETLQGVENFFVLYKSQSERLDKKLREVEAELKQTDSELKAVKANLKQLMPKAKDTDLHREVTVVLEAQSNTTVHLVLSYVVSHAGWSPRYDIRVFSRDKEMQIQYFGIIQQTTGEDWVDAKLSLSTAMPSVGGSAPELPTQTLHFPILEVKRKNKGYFGRSAGGRARLNSKSQPFRGEEEDELLMNSAVHDLALDLSPPEGDNGLSSPMTPPPQLGLATTEAKHSITSTAYKVTRRSTIRTDNAAQKVSIALISLNPSFEYETVPKLAPHAFLKARVKNESPYALLEGPANVFLDNNFVAKTSLGPVSPKEEFECSLGVDRSVRVIYKPVKKFQQHHGIITNKTLVKVEQHIEIRNTRQDMCKIKVSDQLPLSTDDKIKVTPVEPEFRRGEKSRTLADGSHVVLNKTNVLEWMVQIESGKSHTIKLQYSVEHPSGESVAGL